MAGEISGNGGRVAVTKNTVSISSPTPNEAVDMVGNNLYQGTQDMASASTWYKVNTGPCATSLGVMGVLNLNACELSIAFAPSTSLAAMIVPPGGLERLSKPRQDVYVYCTLAAARIAVYACEE